MSRKVFVTRKIPKAGINELEKHFHVEIFQEDRPITKEEIIDYAKDADGLLCLLTDKIDAEIMDKTGVKAIANYAVGYDNIDIKAATERKIAVTNTPGVLTEATADLTWALMLAVSRRVVEADRFVREGKFRGWEPMLFLGGDFYTKTLGIIGMGRIGAAVARRAIGFGMKVIYYSRSPHPDVEKQLGAKRVNLDELLTTSDYVSVHCPYTPETHHLLDEEKLKLMKKTAYLINTARGKVIEEKALIRMLKENKIAGAGFDVFYDEPKINPELLKLGNVVLLPHIGSASFNTRSQMSLIAARNLIAALSGRKPPNIINPKIYD